MATPLSPTRTRRAMKGRPRTRSERDPLWAIKRALRRDPALVAVFEINRQTMNGFWGLSTRAHIVRTYAHWPRVAFATHPIVSPHRARFVEILR